MTFSTSGRRLIWRPCRGAAAKYPANRGRAGVRVEWEECDPWLTKPSGRFHWRDELDKMQRYRVPALGLDADGRVDLAAIMAEERLRRIFRMGLGQNRKKVAVKAWRDASQEARKKVRKARGLTVDAVEALNPKDRAEFEAVVQQRHYKLYPELLAADWREAMEAEWKKAIEGELAKKDDKSELAQKADRSEVDKIRKRQEAVDTDASDSRQPMLSRRIQ